ncbi:MAG: hypothetical protein LBH06_00760 [Rikenellaceae bacterium]|nr:hypothetical protein [Rikenellaceae bacterium]
MKRTLYLAAALTVTAAVVRAQFNQPQDAQPVQNGTTSGEPAQQPAQEQQPAYYSPRGGVRAVPLVMQPRMLRDKENRAWFDFQLTQHMGLNRWNDSRSASDMMPRAAITDLRVALNVPFAPHAKTFNMGWFLDMGVGFMPAPRRNDLNINAFARPGNSVYYLRDISEQNPAYPSVNAHFRMSTGLFATIKRSDRLTIMPYFGLGLTAMRNPYYKTRIKEQGSNLEWISEYSWISDQRSNSYESTGPLGHLTWRLNFSYRLQEDYRLIFGLEYTWIFSRTDFYGSHTNVYNRNIVKDFSVSGNEMNMLGLSVGIAFK